MKWVSIAALALLPIVASAETAPAASAAIEIESTNVAFGEMVPGFRRELPSAIVIRVRSARPWALRLSASTPQADLENRIQWRRGGGPYLPLVQGSAVVASGQATSPAGELIKIDLSLGFGDTDPLGQYAGLFRVTLDAF